jgi:hypothetical protein
MIKIRREMGPGAFWICAVLLHFFKNVQQNWYKMNANFSDFQPRQVAICKFNNTIMTGAKERKHVQSTAAFEMSLVNSKGNKSSA